MSPSYIDREDKVTRRVRFEANTKLGFYRFIDALIEAAAISTGYDEDLIDNEVSDILENKSENYKNIRDYFDGLSYCIIDDIKTIEKHNLKILDYIDTVNIIEVKETPTGNKYRYDRPDRCRPTFKGFESILNT